MHTPLHFPSPFFASSSSSFVASHPYIYESRLYMCNDRPQHERDDAEHDEYNWQRVGIFRSQISQNFIPEIRTTRCR